jgi:hypothetical protein
MLAAMKPKVVRVLEHDRWALAEGTRPVGPFVLRYRTPVITAPDVGSHVQLVQLVWEFDDPRSGAMPEPGVSDTMQEFEDRLCASWERDGLAFLAAVLTIDGARQWILYARDVAECLRRLATIRHEGEPYPVEITSRIDRGWSFLHDAVLSEVDWQAQNPAWEAELGPG